jgi:hypothetical protein
VAKQGVRGGAGDKRHQGEPVLALRDHNGAGGALRGCKHGNAEQGLWELNLQPVISKTTRMHDLVLGLFINRYAFGVAI